jgi:hypothetical protein
VLSPETREHRPLAALIKNIFHDNRVFPDRIGISLGTNLPSKQVYTSNPDDSRGIKPDENVVEHFGVAVAKRKQFQHVGVLILVLVLILNQGGKDRLQA